jgi:hypothetical protein
MGIPEVIGLVDASLGLTDRIKSFRAIQDRTKKLKDALHAFIQRPHPRTPKDQLHHVHDTILENPNFITAQTKRDFSQVLKPLAGLFENASDREGVETLGETLAQLSANSIAAGCDLSILEAIQNVSCSVSQLQAYVAFHLETLMSAPHGERDYLELFIRRQGVQSMVGISGVANTQKVALELLYVRRRLARFRQEGTEEFQSNTQVINVAQLLAMTFQKQISSINLVGDYYAATSDVDQGQIFETYILDNKQIVAPLLNDTVSDFWFWLSGNEHAAYPLDMQLNTYLWGQNSRCVLVLLGDGAIGKSALIKHSTSTMAGERLQQNASISSDPSKKASFPVLIELVSLEKSESINILEHLKSQFSLSLPEHFYETRLLQGGCLICFDALDEVLELGKRQAIIEAIQEFVEIYPNNLYIMTARLEGYTYQARADRNMPAPQLNQDQHLHLVLQPFDEDEIRQALRKWHEAHLTEDLDKCEEAISLREDEIFDPQRKYLLELAGNPLFLTIMCLVGQQIGSLPNQRFELMERCVETLTKSRDLYKQLPLERESYVFQFQVELLQHIAAQMLLNDSGRANSVGPNEIRSWCIDFTTHPDRAFFPSKMAAEPEIDKFIQRQRERTELLIPRGSDDLGFAHRMFQDFLGAREFIRTQGDALFDLLQPWVLNPAWFNILGFVVQGLDAQGKNPGPLLEQIAALPDPGDAILHRPLFIAAHLMATCIKRESQAQADIIKRLTDLTNQPVNYLAIDSVEALGRLHKYDQALEALMNTVESHRISKVRVSAAMALYSFKLSPDHVLRLQTCIAQLEWLDEGIFALVTALIPLLQQSTPIPKILEITQQALKLPWQNAVKPGRLLSLHSNLWAKLIEVGDHIILEELLIEGLLMPEIMRNSNRGKMQKVAQELLDHHEPRTRALAARTILDHPLTRERTAICKQIWFDNQQEPSIRLAFALLLEPATFAEEMNQEHTLDLLQWIQTKSTESAISWMRPNTYSDDGVLQNLTLLGLERIPYSFLLQLTLSTRFVFDFVDHGTLPMSVQLILNRPILDGRGYSSDAIKAMIELWLKCKQNPELNGEAGVMICKAVQGFPEDETAYVETQKLLKHHRVFAQLRQLSQENTLAPDVSIRLQISLNEVEPNQAKLLNNPFTFLHSHEVTVETKKKLLEHVFDVDHTYSEQTLMNLTLDAIDQGLLCQQSLNWFVRSNAVAAFELVNQKTLTQSIEVTLVSNLSDVLGSRLVELKPKSADAKTILSVELADIIQPSETYKDLVSRHPHLTEIAYRAIKRIHPRSSDSA